MKFNYSMLYYGAKSSEEYLSVKSKIVADNKIRLNFFSALAALALIVCFVVSFINSNAASNRYVYLTVALLMAAICVLTSKPVKLGERAIDILSYIFMEILYLGSIIMATILNPDIPTISFDVLLFANPLLFTLAPVNTNVLTTINVAIYFILGAFTQTPDMLHFNSLNIVIYGLLSIVVSTYTMCVKIDRYILIEKNIELSKIDQLTGLPNRRSFEMNIENIKSNELDPDLCILMFDINGLKETNDKYGHGAGDSLIKAAADAIQNTFGPYGTTFRIGGDEFITIASLPDNRKNVDERLKIETEKYAGLFGEKLSISFGAKKVDSLEALDDAVKEADARMYENKRKFYELSGIDRRKNGEER